MNNQKPESINESRRPALRFMRKALLLSTVLVALYLVSILLMSVVSIDSLYQVKYGLRSFGEWWIYVRVAFVAGLIIWWQPLNTWIARRNAWSEAHLARVLAGRWLTLGTLTFVELILIQRIHEPFTDRWLQ